MSIICPVTDLRNGISYPKQIFLKFGIPVMNLFASENAHVTANYVSQNLNDAQAMFHDAFSRQWNYTPAYE